MRPSFFLSVAVVLALRLNEATAAAFASSSPHNSKVKSFGATSINKQVPLTVVQKSTQQEEAQATEENTATSKVQEDNNNDKAQPVFQPRPPDMGPPEQSLRFNTQTSTSGKRAERPGTSPTKMVVVSGAAPRDIQEKHDQLIEKMWEQEQVVLALQRNTTQLESTLTYKTAQLERLQATVKEETPSLKAKIDQFQQKLRQRNDAPQAEKDHQAKIATYQKRQTELEQEVSVLQKDIVRVTNEMRTEQERFATLTQRMEEVDGTQEWEEAEYQRESQELIEMRTAQQLELDELQATVTNGTNVIEQARLALRSPLKSVQADIREIAKKMRDFRQDHLSQSIFLEKAIRKEESDTEDLRQVANSQQSNHSNILGDLQSQLAKTQKENEQVQQLLVQETTAFLERETQLKDTLVDFNKTKDLLLYKLQSIETQRGNENEWLNGRLSVNSKRLAVVEKQVQFETRRHDMVRQGWQAEENDRRGRTRQAKRNMRSRFFHLRSAMIGKLQSAKKEGRSHEKMMVDFYEQDVADTKNALQYLEESIVLSRRNLEDLQGLIYGESETTETLVSTQTKLNNGLTDRLTRANVDLKMLKEDEAALLQRLRQREDDVAELESSWKAIRRATWQLTKGRARRLRIFFLRRKQ